MKPTWDKNVIMLSPFFPCFESGSLQQPYSFNIFSVQLYTLNFLVIPDSKMLRIHAQE